MKRYLVLAAVLVASAAAAVDVKPSTVEIRTTDPAVTVTVTPRLGNTSKSIPLTVNKQDTVIKNGKQLYPRLPPSCDANGQPAGCVPPVVPPPPPTMTHGLNVDTSSVTPAMLYGKFGVPGTAIRVRPTTEQPAVGNGDFSAGAFRTNLGVTHIARNDPIVAPGAKDGSHTHTFFNNADVDENTTTESLLAKCRVLGRGGAINCSAYWASTLKDTRDDKPVIPLQLLAYYKNGNFWVKTSNYGYVDSVTKTFVPWQPPVEFIDIPVGLRMIAGNPKRKVPRKPEEVFDHRWTCILPTGGTVFSTTGGIPEDCPAGGTVLQEIMFPQCWDGKNLDSPDHRSHMAYTINVPNKNAANAAAIVGHPQAGWSHAECPSTHRGGAAPGEVVKVLPDLSFNIYYPVKVTGETKFWKLSSDEYDPALPGGFSSHADYWARWREQPWRKCISNGWDCHAHLLGDGRMIEGPP